MTTVDRSLGRAAYCEVAEGTQTQVPKDNLDHLTSCQNPVPVQDINTEEQYACNLCVKTTTSTGAGALTYTTITNNLHLSKFYQVVQTTIQI